MIVVIDNYDSFTFNLVQYLAELGAELRVLRNDAVTVEELEKLAPDGLVISPGPCTPREAGVSVPAIERFAGRIPILGVCLGHQAIAAAYGGRIIRAPRLMHGKTSEIVHDGQGVFAGLPNPFVATRYHSLMVDESALPAGLIVTARSEDGVIMGLRDRTGLVEGVQFHPESILTTVGKDLLQNFLRQVEMHRREPASLRGGAL
ncbi:aminodeoxychorismate/anthranilate synthase component II [Thermomicrobium sp. CFH 73360]|uniref:anthranilate synthase component II n=1 Tax=Thermomicrobium sp. CFH 73360 TaxID=2951987 RepID=UPI002076B84A|nr:aminodeoxychorismate/anthranilate synthase component II [Thermomicrobium sp. CFH 73360]MCM8745335.1 aminodeoxychorismate/anthranilate synthase component II [Thermomicrobium sp. CFH 73360]